MEKSSMLKKSSIIVLFLLLVWIMMACTGHRKEDTYNVMVTSGIGYQISGEMFLEVNRGATARFKIDIEDGYKYVDSNFGEIDDGYLVIENIKRDISVVILCRKSFEINSTITNGLISILPTDGDFYEDSKVTVCVEPLPNYYLDKVVVNGTEQDFESGFDGTYSFDLIVDQDLEIEAFCLGDQYTFTFQITGLGQLRIKDNNFSDNQSIVIHYGTTLDIEMIPIDNGKVSWINLDGVVTIPTGNLLRIDVSNSVMLQVSFSSENDITILYDENGGCATGDIDALTYQINDYVYLDNCYQKLEKDGYVLVGFNTSADGTGESYNLGAMVKVKENMIFYAEWAKETNSSHFEFTLDKNDYYISGYSLLGLESNETKLVIPQRYLDKDIVGILEDSLSNNQVIKEIILSDKIQYVYDSAFSNCVNLEKIVLSENLMIFKNSALEGNDNLKTIRYNETSSPVLDNMFGRYALYFADLAVKDRKPRYILVSGSSGQFGIDPTFFNEKMDKEILVFGVNVGFYMEALLTILSHYLIPGDTVIFTPEFMNSGYEAEASHFPYNIVAWLRNTLLFEKMDYRWDKVEFGKFFDNIGTLKSGANPFYRIENDEYGVLLDYRENVGEYTDFNWSVLHMHSTQINQKTKEYLLNVKKLIEDKEAKFYFSFAPTSARAFIETGRDGQIKEDFLEKLYREYKDINIISVVDDYIYDNKYFYDSIYHLSSEGATMRTAQLIKDIEAQLAKENGSNDK